MRLAKNAEALLRLQHGQAGTIVAARSVQKQIAV